MDAELAVSVIAVGFPALLIAFGWLSFMAGTGLQAGGSIGDLGLRSFGMGMIVTGVLLYLFEIIVYLIYLEYG